MKLSLDVDPTSCRHLFGFSIHLTSSSKKVLEMPKSSQLPFGFFEWFIPLSFGREASIYKDKNLPSKLRSNDRLCPGNDMDLFQIGREIPDPPYLRSLNWRRKWAGHKVRQFEKRALCLLTTFFIPTAFNGSLCCLRLRKSLPGVCVSLKVGDPANKRRCESCKDIGFVIFFMKTGRSVLWVSIEPFV